MANRKHLIFWLVAGLLLVFAGLRDIYAPGLLTMHRITFSRSQVALELAGGLLFTGCAFWKIAFSRAHKK